MGSLPRRAGFLFGADIVIVFNHTNNQLVWKDQEMFDNSIVTVWSAPNYCYRCGNIAAILELGEGGSGEGAFCRVCRILWDLEVD
jgi:hypothetical protein